MINLLSNQITNEKEVKNMKRNKKKGFTLIELIVVIAILGILAAVAVPRLSGFTTSAKIKSNIAGIQQLQSVVRIYEADKGTLPTQLSDLQASGYLGTGVTPKAPAIVAATGVDAAAACVATNVYLLNTATGDVSIGAIATGLVAISAAAQ